jgi:hypothetical protein
VSSFWLESSLKLSQMKPETSLESWIRGTGTAVKRFIVLPVFMGDSVPRSPLGMVTTRSATMRFRGYLREHGNPLFHGDRQTYDDLCIAPCTAFRDPLTIYWGSKRLNHNMSYVSRKKDKGRSMVVNSQGALRRSLKATKISRTPDKQGSILQPATMLCGHSYLSSTGWIRTVLYFLI